MLRRLRQAIISSTVEAQQARKRGAEEFLAQELRERDLPGETTTERRKFWERLQAVFHAYNIYKEQGQNPMIEIEGFGAVSLFSLLKDQRGHVMSGLEIARKYSHGRDSVYLKDRTAQEKERAYQTMLALARIGQRVLGGGKV